jgi:hypothetical protein
LFSFSIRPANAPPSADIALNAINAAVTGKVDRLEGLKENVIIGRLSPTGTGFGTYHGSEAAMENMGMTQEERMAS